MLHKMDQQQNDEYKTKLKTNRRDTEASYCAAVTWLCRHCTYVHTYTLPVCYSVVTRALYVRMSRLFACLSVCASSRRILWSCA